MVRTALLTASLLAFGASTALAGGYYTPPPSHDCGCAAPMPTKPVKMKVKSNSGVGNGAEGGATEAHDRDPGNSGANNQAGKNSFKPNSARAGTSIP